MGRSQPLGLGCAQESCRPQNQHEEQHEKGREFPDLCSAIPVCLRLDDAQQQATDDRSRQRAEPAIIMAVSPLKVAHMPNMGVSCCSAVTIRKPPMPPMAEARMKADSSTRSIRMPMNRAARGASATACSLSPNWL